MRSLFILGGALAALLNAPAGLAEEPSKGSGPSAQEIAEKLADPNATLGFLSTNLDFIRYQGDLPGASGESAWKLSLQPSLPYPLAKDTNLFVRPLIPIVLDQPVPVVFDGPVFQENRFESRGVELGDIGFDAAIGKTLSNGTVLFGGIVGTLPTATDDDIGLDQWLLGPEVFVGKTTSWGFVGALFTHQWDVAGDDDFSTSITGGQYFYTINLGNAWQIQAQPTWSYNWEAGGGDRWTFPLGIGVSKTVIIGATPVKFNLQGWYYVATPDTFGPEFQIRLAITPVVPLPW